MQEIIVIIACFYSKGCVESSTHYYQTHSELQEIAKNGKHKAQQLVGPFTVRYVLPTVAAAYGNDVYISITKNYGIKLEQDKISAQYTEEF